MTVYLAMCCPTIAWVLIEKKLLALKDLTELEGLVMSNQIKSEVSFFPNLIYF